MIGKFFERFAFDLRGGFDHPLTIVIVIVVLAGLIGGRWLISQLYRRGVVPDDLQREVLVRWKSWCWLAPVLIVPVLLGPGWTMFGVMLLSLLCYREYARATGLFRERTISVCVVAGILLAFCAAFDHFERLFFATGPLTVALIATATLQSDRPSGYIQRVALGVFGFLLTGFSLGYLGQLANVGDIGNGTDYRPILLLILVAVALNDVFAFCVGKSFGGGKLLPNTSPGKTVSGAVGAMLLTMILVTILGHFIFKGTRMDSLGRLATLGIIISGLGQLGDLILSSIKRDVGIKDTGQTIPGHGGLLDRFDSLLLVPPAVYHYLSLNLDGFASSQLTESIRIFTGG